MTIFDLVQILILYNTGYNTDQKNELVTINTLKLEYKNKTKW